MGFLSKVVGKVAKAVGLGGSSPNLSAEAAAAEAAERIKLEEERKKRNKEANFLNTEGQGLRRRASLSFGSNTDNELGSKQRDSVAATGRFDDNRLIL